MPIVMNMRWQGVTAEQYDQARELVNWEGDVPDGAKFHVASFDGTALRVTDVWDSADVRSGPHLTSRTAGRCHHSRACPPGCGDSTASPRRTLSAGGRAVREAARARRQVDRADRNPR